LHFDEARYVFRVHDQHVAVAVLPGVVRKTRQSHAAV